MKAQIVLTQNNEKTGETIQLPFLLNFNKHNKDNIMGTLAHEITKGLQLLKKWRAKGSIKSNIPVTVLLKIGDITLDTAKLDRMPQDKATILKGLQARLKINAGNPKSEADFFQMLNEMFDYMVAPIGFMGLQQFVNERYVKYDLLREDRSILKELKDAVLQDAELN